MSNELDRRRESTHRAHEAARRYKELGNTPGTRLCKILAVPSGSNPNVFFRLAPVIVSGDEIEGSPGTFDLSPKSFLALNVGQTKPRTLSGAGYVEASFVSHRWIFNYDSSSAGQAQANCDCLEDDYDVDAECGECMQTMPRYWWVAINESTEKPYVTPCPATPCNVNLEGTKIRLEAIFDEYGGFICEWIGQGPHCLFAQLAYVDDRWRLRIYDKNDCIISETYIAKMDFKCCGINTAWAPDPYTPVGSCELDLTVEPDPCTCCPDEGPPPCPPDGIPVCDATECCLENCVIPVVIEGLSVTSGDPETGEPPPVEKQCSNLNGTFYVSWKGNCYWEWRSEEDVLGTDFPHRVVVQLIGNSWHATVYGGSGQTASFVSIAVWNCAMEQIDMEFVQGTSTCDGVSGPTAKIHLDW
jgi:hypothetical protein